MNGMRITDDVLQEIIDNGGCRKGAANPVNSTGVVRLALDLQEARSEVARLKKRLDAAK